MLWRVVDREPPGFVKSLLTNVRALNPSELFAVAMQAGAFADKDSRPFVMAGSTGKFPVEELEKFAEGKPSMVDDFASNKDFSLEIVDGKIKIPEDRPSEPVDPFSLPDAPALDDGAPDRLSEAHGDATRMSALDARNVEAITAQATSGVPVVRVAERATNVHDVRMLADLGDVLMRGGDL